MSGIVIFYIPYIQEQFIHIHFRKLNFSSWMYFKQDRESGTMGTLFCMKLENNYTFLQNISFNKSHWDQPLYNSKWVFCTMKWNGEGNGNPLQYSCLGNPMDRRTWQATVREVTKSWTPIEHKMKKDHKVTYQSLYSIKENLLIYWFTTLITRKKRVKF